jgi:hypothetical protein
MKLSDVVKAWNTLADPENGWDSLDADEYVEFTLSLVQGEVMSAIQEELDSAWQVHSGACLNGNTVMQVQSAARLSWCHKIKDILEKLLR